MIGVGSILTGLDASITEHLPQLRPEHDHRFQIQDRLPLQHLARRGACASRSPRTTRAPSTSAARRWSMSARTCSRDWRQIHRAKYKGNDMYNIDIGGTEEGYAAGGTVMLHGRFLSDDGQPPSPAGGGDRRGLCRRPGSANLDPIGKTIEVDGHQFEVIGVDAAARRIVLRRGRSCACCCPTARCRRCTPSAQGEHAGDLRAGGQTAAGHG